MEYIHRTSLIIVLSTDEGLKKSFNKFEAPTCISFKAQHCWFQFFETLDNVLNVDVYESTF